MIQPTYAGERWKLWAGDALPILQTFPDECVHLVVTSPPYYIQPGYYTDLADDLENQPTWEEYLAKLLAILRECARVVVRGGKLCINIADSWTSLKYEKTNRCLPTHAHIIVYLEKECRLIYKGSFLYTQLRAHHASGGALHLYGSFPYPPNIPVCNFYEYILIFQKGGKYRPAIATREIREASKLTKEEFVWASTGIWQLPPNRRRDICPAPFPPEIPYRLIKMFSFVGDTVLDPFVGSGITLYNALRLNRVAWGIDINRRYIDYIYHNLSAGLVDIFSDNQQP